MKSQKTAIKVTIHPEPIPYDTTPEFIRKEMI
jgi:hypothetical protein